MNQRTKYFILWGLTLFIPGIALSVSNHAVTFHASGSLGVDELIVSPAPGGGLSSVQIKFSHREKNSRCNFEVVAQAKRLPQKPPLDDWNEALPDGSYIKYADFSADSEAIHGLSLDVSSKLPRFASITVAIPIENKSPSCLNKGNEMESIFFR
jgi:hypothetical protein